MQTKEQSTDSWKNCISEQKMPSNPYKVVCEEPTIAKYLKISVAGNNIPLYLKEVEVVGKYVDGEYGLLFLL